MIRKDLWPLELPLCDGTSPTSRYPSLQPSSSLTVSDSTSTARTYTSIQSLDTHNERSLNQINDEARYRIPPCLLGRSMVTLDTEAR